MAISLWELIISPSSVNVIFASNIVCDLPETMRKLRPSTKLLHQEISQNYRILRSVSLKAY